MSWLPLRAGPAPAWLAERVAWWRAREAALAAHGPDVLAPAALTADAHRQATAWLPLAPLRDDLEDALRAWFDLDALPLDLAATDLGGWRSWPDARARLPGVRRFALPSGLLAALGAPGPAHDLLFELAAPPALGSTLGRYGARLERLAALAPGGLAWDVGCGTGEGTWELALALPPGADVVGTTPCPLQRLMAARRDRPHDPTRGAALRALVGDAPGRTARFVRHDLLRDPPPGAFHAIACHGLLGEGVAAPDEVARAVATLAGALLPGGALSITDRFRDDRHARAAALVQAAATAAGLTALGEGLFLR
ncbi:MAG: class I SAM-dependent methyltransferase [Planctomycetes bacterium]|nr:class I SAM-dependent methyltransferase [Planctomycetota bacterium]